MNLLAFRRAALATSAKNWVYAAALVILFALACAIALKQSFPGLYPDSEGARIAARGVMNLERGQPREVIFRKLRIDPARLQGPQVHHNHLLVEEIWQLSRNYVIVLDGSALQPGRFSTVFAGKSRITLPRSFWATIRDWFLGL
jgi:hypothetical protein